MGTLSGKGEYRNTLFGTEKVKVSKPVITESKYKGYSKMAIAIKKIGTLASGSQDGLFHQRVVIKTGNVRINSEELDCEFDIPFDDDTEANEAEIIVYNLTNKTINAMKNGANITVSAGYGKDVGIIFSGKISSKKTTYEDCDKVTTITAIDGQTERDIESIDFAAGTNASFILRRLVEKTGYPIAVWVIRRDYTYQDDTTVDGGLMDNIKKYAKICQVSAYICKGKVYVCPLNYVNTNVFNLTADTGLISAEPFEQTETNESYNDKISGYNCKMLLQHTIQTGNTINIKTKNVKGQYRVKEGTHTYDGNELITTIKAVKV